MRRLRVTKILDTVTLSDTGDKTQIKYTVPIEVRRHDFNVDIGLFVINGGASNDVDIHFQYGISHPNKLYTIEADQFGGSGLNDITIAADNFEGVKRKRIKIEIDGTGSPDTFKWSINDGESYEAEGVNCATSAIALANGITVLWAANTGHTSGDFWFTTITEILWDATTTKAIDAISCAASQKYEAETLKPCQWIRFWADNQHVSSTAIITLLLLTQIGE